MVRAMRDAGLFRACLHVRMAQRMGLAYTDCAIEAGVTPRRAVERQGPCPRSGTDLPQRSTYLTRSDNYAPWFNSSVRPPRLKQKRRSAPLQR